jgi:hypothetical protein
MPDLLLTGAGFSRNWGGWLANEVFEYLLGCPEINQDIHTAIWRSKPKRGRNDGEVRRAGRVI